MIRNLYQIKCNGCGLGCGGVFDDLSKARALVERLHWVEIGGAGWPDEAFEHYCPNCARRRAKEARADG